MKVIHILRKPLSEKTVAANVLKWGTGGLHIDRSRVGDEEMRVTCSDGVIISENTSMSGGNTGRIDCGTKRGRWPSNVILGPDVHLPCGEFFLRVGGEEDVLACE